MQHHVMLPGACYSLCLMFATHSFKCQAGACMPLCVIELPMYHVACFTSHHAQADHRHAAGEAAGNDQV